jgi:hypothetical protein
VSVSPIRMALGAHLGQVLTPEIAAAIELAAGFAAPAARTALPKFASATCGSLTFQVERFSGILPELHLLHVEHWEQTEEFRHHIPMNPDYVAMARDEDHGRMVQFTARAGAELVGNLRVYVVLGRHTQTLHAVEDTMYLKPLHRTPRAALRFVEFAEKCLRQIGVREIRCTAKLSNNAARFFEGMGYRPVATELVKFLKE